MGRYQKRPIEITDAVQVRWSTWSEVCEFVGDVINPDNPGRYISSEEASDTCGESGPNYIAFDVPTAHGEMVTVRHGDWVVPDAAPGTFYPVKPEVFAATYEPVQRSDRVGGGA